MSTFTPVNALEQELEKARAGTIGMAEFLGTFVNAEIAVVSDSELRPDGGGFQPMLYARDGVDMIAVFTSSKRLAPFVERAPHSILIRAGDFLRQVKPGVGVVINPGSPIGFDLSPEGVRKIVDSLA